MASDSSLFQSPVTRAPGIEGAVLDFERALAEIPPASRYLIALSGGVDSVLLLALAVPHLKANHVEVAAIHVNHGLSPNADSWQSHCEQLCQTLGVECLIEPVTVAPTQAEGLEAAARTERYRAIRRHVDRDTVVLFGHHENDQCETILMRILKGSDPRLLMGMPGMRSLGVGHLYRPWLTISRDKIEQRAEQMGLSWVEDESNADVRFKRNEVRQQILPALEQSYQQVSHVQKRSAREDLLVLARAAGRWVAVEQRLFQCLAPSAKVAAYAGLEALSLRFLQSLSEPALSQFLRGYLADRQLPQPSEAILRRAAQELVHTRTGSHGLLEWRQGALMRYADHVYAIRKNVAEGDQVALERINQQWTQSFCEGLRFSVPDAIPGREMAVTVMNLSQFQRLQATGELSGIADDHDGDCCNVIALCERPTSIQFRSRQVGDKFQQRKVKDYWRHLALPAQWRESQLLLEIDGQVAWAGWDADTFGTARAMADHVQSVILLKSHTKHHGKA